MSSDRGAAAVELALVMTLLTALLALVAPLTVLFHARVQLGQAAGELSRFVTSRSDVPRRVGTVVIPRGLLPSDAALQQEFLRFGIEGSVALSPPRNEPARPDADCPSGGRRTVTLTTTAQLGPAGAVFAGLTGSDTTKTLTATASSCEE